MRLVDAVNSDDPSRELSDRDVKKAAKRRQRVAGTAVALGGPVRINIASLYCEAEILCDVAERHRLRLCDEELAVPLRRLALLASRPRLRGLDLAVLLRRVGDELAKQRRGRLLDGGDGALEGLGVGRGRLREAADLADVLHGRAVDLVGGRGRLEVV